MLYSNIKEIEINPKTENIKVILCIHKAAHCNHFSTFHCTLNWAATNHQEKPPLYFGNGQRIAPINLDQLFSKLSTSSKCVEINLSCQMYHHFSSVLSEHWNIVYKIWNLGKQNFQKQLYTYCFQLNLILNLFAGSILILLSQYSSAGLITLFINFLSGIAVTLPLILSPESYFAS